MTIFYETDSISSALAFSSALTGVGAGGYSPPSTAIDNTYSGGNNRLYGKLLLTFSTALTAGSTGPTYVMLFVHPLLDGTTYPNPPGNTAAAPSTNARQVPAIISPGVSYSALVFDIADLDPFKTAFQFFNNTGVSWSGGGTIIATLYRFGMQGV